MELADLSPAEQVVCLENELQDERDRAERFLAEIEKLSAENERLQSLLATIEGLWQTMCNHEQMADVGMSKARQARHKLEVFIANGQ